MHRERVQLVKNWNRRSESAEWGCYFLCLILTASYWSVRLTWELINRSNSVYHWYSYHPIAFKILPFPAQCMAHHSFPSLFKLSSQGSQFQNTLCFSPSSISLQSLTSFSSSLTRVRPHQSCVAERVSIHINTSPPLTLRLVKGRRVGRMIMSMTGLESGILLTLIFLFTLFHNHRWARTGSMLPWWSTASSCGSLCLYACSARWACSCSRSSRTTQPRPSTCQVDHFSPATITLTDSSPTNQHSRTWAGGGGWVWVLMCLWYRNRNWNKQQSHPLPL